MPKDPVLCVGHHEKVHLVLHTRIVHLYCSIRTLAKLQPTDLSLQEIRLARLSHAILRGEMPPPFHSPAFRKLAHDATVTHARRADFDNHRSVQLIGFVDQREGTNPVPQRMGRRGIWCGGARWDEVERERLGRITQHVQSGHGGLQHLCGQSVSLASHLPIR